MGSPYIPARMEPSPHSRIGPPRLSPARTIAAGAIILVTAIVAYYALDARQRNQRLQQEVDRLHEVTRLLRDSLDAARGASALPPSRRR